MASDVVARPSTLAETKEVAAQFSRWSSHSEWQLHALRPSYVCGWPRRASLWRGGSDAALDWRAALAAAALAGDIDEAEAERRMAQLFVAVSWRWLTPTHPDPDGKQVAALAALAAPYLGHAPTGQLGSTVVSGAAPGSAAMARDASSAKLGDGSVAGDPWREATVRTEV